MERMGINTILDALLMAAEILMTIGTLITRISQEQLSQTSAQKPGGNSRSATLNQLADAFPIMTALGGTCEFCGVILFMLGFLYCAKEVSVWSYQSYQYKQQKKRREKNNSMATRKVQILPTDAKQNNVQILRRENTEFI